MPNNRTITSADAILMIAVEDLFPTPQRIQGFSADNVTSTDAVAQMETVDGVDGRMSIGWVYASVPQTITLMPDSESNDFFDTWWSYQQQQRRAFVATGTLVLPATNKKYAMTRGALLSAPRFPTVAKTLQARPFALKWERITVAPV